MDTDSMNCPLALRQQGQASLEFIVASLFVLMLASLCLDTLYAHHLQHRLHAALLQAARAGIVHHNAPESIKQHFRQSLAHARDLNTAWEIRIVSPSREHFLQLPATELARHYGVSAIIDNDYPHLSADPALARQANTLVLDLHYQYRPLSPLLRLGLQTFLFPEWKIQIRLPMQSHPILWQNTLPQKSKRVPPKNHDKTSPSWPLDTTVQAWPNKTGTRPSAPPELSVETAEQTIDPETLFASCEAVQ